MIENKEFGRSIDNGILSGVFKFLDNVCKNDDHCAHNLTATQLALHVRDTIKESIESKCAEINKLNEMMRGEE